jgi:hypothetical protein
LKQGVIPEKKGECPPPIAKEILDAFNVKGKPTPKEHPSLMDWRSPLTTLWNTQAIYLLVNKFLKEIENGQYPQVRLHLKDYPKDWLIKLCTSKLQCTQALYHDTLPPDPGSHETPEEKSMRVAKRNSKTKAMGRKGSQKAQVHPTFNSDN